MQALLMPVAGELYALAISDVREVVRRPAVTPLPRMPAAVLGVFNLRGEVVPLLDTAALLGLRPAGEAAYVVVAETAAGPAGLTADELPARTVEPVPEAVPLDPRVLVAELGAG